MAVRHTVHDPRRERVLAQREAPGGVGLLVPPSLSSSAAGGRGGGYGLAGRDLAAIDECSSVASGTSRLERDPRPGSAAGGPRESALLRREPWRSDKVAEFAASLGQDKARDALVLEGPRGTALRAIGEAEDHKVASKMVVDIELRRAQGPASGGAGPSSRGEQASQLQERARASDGGRYNELAPRPRGGVGEEAAFGAVYEYRDSCGTPKVVASTDKLPERQFLMDRRRHGDVLAAHQEPQLVWVGVSGGAGGLDDGQMTEVRRAVAEGRAERLQAQKLTDIKPYSRHG